ncbi:MAG: COG4280 domain-containing protein [Acidimicrobiales bacterium]
MTTSEAILALAVFGASSVEMVEALTIVLAAGVSRGWRSAFEGAAAAAVVLAVLVAAVGVPLVHLVPINTLRVVIGGLLLVLGLNWLRKAILRASGHKALHDEDAIYSETVSSLAASKPASTRDALGFTVAFKGVFLEGLEVVLIVLTLGSSSRHLALAAVSAAAAVIVVGVIGAIVGRQLSEVPENAMKMGVGIMLTSFGVFWVGEGSGLRWPGSDLFLLALVGLFVITTAAAVRLMKNALPSAAERAA